MLDVVGVDVRCLSPGVASRLSGEAVVGVGVLGRAGGREGAAAGHSWPHPSRLPPQLLAHVVSTGSHWEVD